MKMIADRIKVRIIPDKEETKESGIIVMANSITGRINNYVLGIVEEVGSGRVFDNGVKGSMTVKVGDKVIWMPNTRPIYKDDDGEYQILYETPDVVAIVEEN